MRISEIHDANDLVNQINHPTGRPRWAWWAPGDATRYHVTLLHAQPSDAMSAAALGTACGDVFRALVVTIDPYATRPRSIVIPRPIDDTDRYTAGTWLSHGFPAGWWPGIRPLLAALGWTAASDRDTTYRRTDHQDITTTDT